MKNFLAKVHEIGETPMTWGSYFKVSAIICAAYIVIFGGILLVEWIDYKVCITKTKKEFKEDLKKSWKKI